MDTKTMSLQKLSLPLLTICLSQPSTGTAYLFLIPQGGPLASPTTRDASPSFWEATVVAIFSLVSAGGTPASIAAGDISPASWSATGTPSSHIFSHWLPYHLQLPGHLARPVGSYRHHHHLHDSHGGTPESTVAGDTLPAFWAALDAAIFSYFLPMLTVSSLADGGHLAHLLDGIDIAIFFATLTVGPQQSLPSGTTWPPSEQAQGLLNLLHTQRGLPAFNAAKNALLTPWVAAGTAIFPPPLCGIFSHFCRGEGGLGPMTSWPQPSYSKYFTHMLP
jgi:hypothetical protein